MFWNDIHLAVLFLLLFHLFIEAPEQVVICLYDKINFMFILELFMSRNKQ